MAEWAAGGSEEEEAEAEEAAPSLDQRARDRLLLRSPSGEEGAGVSPRIRRRGRGCPGAWAAAGGGTGGRRCGDPKW